MCAKASMQETSEETLARYGASTSGATTSVAASKSTAQLWLDAGMRDVAHLMAWLGWHPTQQTLNTACERVIREEGAGMSHAVPPSRRVDGAGRAACGGDGGGAARERVLSHCAGRSRRFRGGGKGHHVAVWPVASPRGPRHPSLSTLSGVL